MGIRKIQGASRKQIILQLLLETFTIVSVAILLGGVFLEFALPHMNHWIQYEVMLDYTSPQLYSIFASVLVVVTLAAGLYPAYYITSFSASSLLRSDSIKPTSRVGLIKILVGIQFVISTMLLTATVIMQKQMDYLNEKDLGLLAEGVLVINANSKINQLQYESFKKDLLDLPEVKKVAAGPMPDRSFSTPV